MNRWQHGAIIGITGLYGFFMGISYENRYTPQERLSQQPKQRIYDTAETIYDFRDPFHDSIELLAGFCYDSTQNCGLYVKRLSGESDSILSELHARNNSPLIDDYDTRSFLSDDIPPREIIVEGLGKYLVPEKPFYVNKSIVYIGTPFDPSYTVTEIVNPPKTRAVQYWDENHDLRVDYLILKKIDTEYEFGKIKIGIEDSTREANLRSSTDLRNLYIALAAKKEGLLDTADARDLFMDLSGVPRRFPVDYRE